jgi:hypothetical protein
MPKASLEHMVSPASPRASISLKCPQAEETAEQGQNMDGRRCTPINADQKQTAYPRSSAFIGGQDRNPEVFQHPQERVPHPALDSAGDAGGAFATL